MHYGGGKKEVKDVELGKKEANLFRLIAKDTILLVYKKSRKKKLLKLMSKINKVVEYTKI